MRPNGTGQIKRQYSQILAQEMQLKRPAVGMKTVKTLPSNLINSFKM
jgi:hypothetical protein